MKTPGTRVRFEIPQNPKKKLSLAKKVNAKHIADGPSSLLSTLDWATQGPNIATALTHHNKAENYRRLMEQEYEARNVLMLPIDQIIRQSRDVLKGVFRKTPHKAGEWGFKVIETPVTIRKRKRKANDIAAIEE